MALGIHVWLLCFRGGCEYPVAVLQGWMWIPSCCVAGVDVNTQLLCCRGGCEYPVLWGLVRPDVCWQWGQGWHLQTAAGEGSWPQLSERYRVRKGGTSGVGSLQVPRRREAWHMCLRVPLPVCLEHRYCLAYLTPWLPHTYAVRSSFGITRCVQTYSIHTVFITDLTVTCEGR